MCNELLIYKKKRLIDGILMTIFLSATALLTCVEAIIGNYYGSFSLPPGVIAMLRIISISILLAVRIKKVNKNYVIFSFVLLILYSFSGLLSYKNLGIILNITLSGTYVTTVLFALYCSTLDEVSFTYKTIIFNAYIIIVSLIIKRLVGGSKFNYMAFGYGIIVYWVFLLQKCFIEKRKADIIFTVVTGVIIALYSNRMVPIIQVFSFFIFSYKYLKRKSKVYIYLFCALLCGFTLVYAKEILLFIMGLLQAKGIVSRNISALLGNDRWIPVANNIRIEMWKEAGSIILENPFWGRGIGSDRLAFGQYVHNMEIELLMSLGIFVGTLAVLLIILSIYNIVNKWKPDTWLYLILPFAICGFMQLQASGSIYENFEIKIAIALFLTRLARKKQYRQNYNR